MVAEPGGLKLCFLWLQANAIGHTFLSPQIPPATDLVGSGVQNNGKPSRDASSFTSSCLALIGTASEIKGLR